MSRRLVVTLSDEHYAWLEEVRKREGLETVQDAARRVIAEVYKADKVSRRKTKEEKNI